MRYKTKKQLHKERIEKERKRTRNAFKNYRSRGGIIGKLLRLFKKERPDVIKRIGAVFVHFGNFQPINTKIQPSGHSAKMCQMYSDQQHKLAEMRYHDTNHAGAH